MSHTYVLHFRQIVLEPTLPYPVRGPRQYSTPINPVPTRLSPQSSHLSLSLDPRDRLFRVRTGDQNGGYHVVRPHGYECVYLPRGVVIELLA